MPVHSVSPVLFVLSLAILGSQLYAARHSGLLLSTPASPTTAQRFHILESLHDIWHEVSMTILAADNISLKFEILCFWGVLDDVAVREQQQAVLVETLQQLQVLL